MKPLTIFFLLVGAFLCLFSALQVFGHQNMGALIFAVLGSFVWYLAYLTLGPEDETERALAPPPPSDPFVYPDEGIMTKALKEAFSIPDPSTYS